MMAPLSAMPSQKLSGHSEDVPHQELRLPRPAYPLFESLMLAAATAFQQPVHRRLTELAKSTCLALECNRFVIAHRSIDRPVRRLVTYYPRDGRLGSGRANAIHELCRRIPGPIKIPKTSPVGGSVVLIRGNNDILLLQRNDPSKAFTHLEAKLLDILWRNCEPYMPHTAADLPVPRNELGLSPRVAQVLEFLLRGLDEKGIAHELRLSKDTVHTYVKTLYRTMQVNSRQQLLVQFLRPRDTLPSSMRLVQGHQLRARPLKIEVKVEGGHFQPTDKIVSSPLPVAAVDGTSPDVDFSQLESSPKRADFPRKSNSLRSKGHSHSRRKQRFHGYLDTLAKNLRKGESILSDIPLPEFDATSGSKSPQGEVSVTGKADPLAPVEKPASRPVVERSSDPPATQRVPANGQKGQRNWGLFEPRGET